MEPLELPVVIELFTMRRDCIDNVLHLHLKAKKQTTKMEWVTFMHIYNVLSYKKRIQNRTG